MEVRTSGSAQGRAGKREKRFQCPDCERAFARLEHLQRHERIHSGEKPFSCPECNYSFTRSDLLVRHERLTHHKHRNDQNTQLHQADPNHFEYQSHKRKRSAPDNDGALKAYASSPPTYSHALPTQYRPSTPFSGMNFGHADEFSLTALSMAAEYQSLHGDLNGAASVRETPELTPLPPARQTISEHVSIPDSLQTQNHASTLEGSLESLMSFLENEPFDSYQFASLISAEQPMPFFSPDTDGHNEVPMLADSGTAPISHERNYAYEQRTISRFGSRFPSLQPEASRDNGARQSLPNISNECREVLLERIAEFSSVIPSDFKLPTRLALRRYLAAYINGFHEHMPFLHIPSMSVETCSVELVLALAAVGAQYTFEGEKGVQLFNASRAIATHRIRRRDARLVELQHRSESDISSPVERNSTPARYLSPGVSATRGPLGLPLEADALGEDLVQTAQALLLLMAMSTWAKHKEILREALAIQSVLATLIRDDGLQLDPLFEELSWADWIRRETTKRTKFIVYGFSNLHCIVYNIPPFLLTSEVKMALPCSAAEFRASTEEAWQEARKKSAPEIPFQEALKRLFSKNGQEVTETNSSSGNYALIHALIQHIFFLRQVARCRFDGSGDLSSEDVSSLENALRNWQTGWRQNPESSLDPMSPDGPVAFNSTALLRLAYIRLYLDTAGRALDTRDPVLIAHAFRAGPAIKRSRKISRAVLHSAHALSIPIKIGYRLVAKTQSFIWSIQHSLCTLECAYLMSKWLEAIAAPGPGSAPTDDERRIVAVVKNMLDETEFAVPEEIPVDSLDYIKRINAGVLRVWATIFRGSQTWAIVDVIGSALNLYADMLEAA